MTLAGIGLVIGLAGAFAGGRVLASLLFQVQPSDPMTHIGVAVLLGAVALLASYVAARRACKIDPMAALRQE